MFSSTEKPHYTNFLVIILLVAAGVFMVSLAVPEKLAGLLSSSMAPGEFALDVTGKGIGEFWQTITSLSTMKKELEKEKEEKKLLQAQLEEMKIYREENIALRNLLDLRKDQDGEGQAVILIGRDSTNWFDRMIVNGGKARGIHKKMIVLAPGGLAGQITSTSSSTATVRSILNPRSAVPVYVVESGSYGILYGDGTAVCTMKYIRNISFLREGQLVITSGLGDLYPPGLTVGKIIKVQGSVDNASNCARVKPFVNFENLRHMLVVRGKS